MHAIFGFVGRRWVGFGVRENDECGMGVGRGGGGMCVACWRAAGRGVMLFLWRSGGSVWGCALARSMEGFGCVFGRGVWRGWMRG